MMNTKKNFEEPALHVIAFEAIDIITTSEENYKIASDNGTDTNGVDIP